jgi:PBP1b-binding outer membrane lipoprotein LpoB
MLTLKKRFGLVAGIVSLFCLMVVAGCSSEVAPSQTDKEAAANAAKVSTKTAPPAGAPPKGVEPPPP